MNNGPARDSSNGQSNDMREEVHGTDNKGRKGEVGTDGGRNGGRDGGGNSERDGERDDTDGTDGTKGGNPGYGGDDRNSQASNKADALLRRSNKQAGRRSRRRWQSRRRSRSSRGR